MAVLRMASELPRMTGPMLLCADGSLVMEVDLAA